MATCATIGILITYILIALSGIVFFARERPGWNPLLDFVVPAGAIAICGYTLYKSIHPTPAYTGIVKWAPCEAIIWLAIGVAGHLVLTVTQPDRVSAPRGPSRRTATLRSSGRRGTSGSPGCSARPLWPA